MEKLKKMRGEKIKLVLVAWLFLLALAGSALAETVNSYTGAGTFVYNETGSTKLSIGSVIQVIKAAGAAPSAPDNFGNLTGGDVLVGSNGTVEGLAGAFYLPRTLSAGDRIYVRAWNANSIGSATKYNDSAVLTVISSPSAPINWPVPSFATTKDKSTSDTIRPTMTFNPTSNATNVATNQNIVVTFSEAMNTSSVTYTLPNATGLSAAWSVGNTVLTISHAALANSTSYTLTITAAKDVAGNDFQGTNSTNFTTAAVVTTPLNITTTSLPNGRIGTAYSQTLAATGGTTPYTWSISSGTLPAGLTINTSTGTITGTPTTRETANFTAQVSGGGTDTQTLSITIDPAIATISTITPNPARIGQTITINGSGFGDAPNGNFVNFGTIQGHPTVWRNGQIIVAVPAGVTSGSVTVANGTSQTLNISTDKVYLDDFEGGATDNWEMNYDTDTAPDSGYYKFGVGITFETPAANDGAINNAAIVTDSARGGKVFKVQYSFPAGSTEWGGGWGAQLANQLDLSAAQSIKMDLNWDGSANDLQFVLVDSDGTTMVYTITGSTLSGLTGYRPITMNKSNFELTTSSIAGSDTFFDWTKVTNYTILHKTRLASVNFASYDNITANLADTPPPATGEVVVLNISPAAAPAGTKVTITGRGFGATRGQSILGFQHYIANEAGRTNRHLYDNPLILSWSDSIIEAVIPVDAPAGSYDVRVTKLIADETAQNVVRSYASNDSPFAVTANGAVQGGNAIIYPNPFNPMPNQPGAQAVNAASIAFNPGSATNIGVYLYDMTAKVVMKRTIDTQANVDAAAETVKPLGWDGAKALWNGYDLADNLAGDGAYIVRIIDEDSKQLIAKGKILVIKRK